MDKAIECIYNSLNVKDSTIEKVNKDIWVGIRKREDKSLNYQSLYMNLKTYRFGDDDLGEPKELKVKESEFYDVGINTYCQAGCAFCYTNATTEGSNFEDISKNWEYFINSLSDKNNRPYQIAIGSTGEPTDHPQFCEFLETVYKTGVVPNYTTNGLSLSFYNSSNPKRKEIAEKILEYTSKYVGGVAVSYSHKHIRKQAKEAVYVLKEHGNCHINLHHIISDKDSVDDFIQCVTEFGDTIKYHVLLPLMPYGRSKKGMDGDAFEYLESRLIELDIKNVAFGANFFPYLKDTKLQVWSWGEHLYSKNMLIKKDVIEFTPSSFDLTVIDKIDVR